MDILRSQELNAYTILSTFIENWQEEGESGYNCKLIAYTTSTFGMKPESQM